MKPGRVDEILAKRPFVREAVALLLAGLALAAILLASTMVQADRF